jgi:hypothetical protein
LAAALTLDKGTSTVGVTTAVDVATGIVCAGIGVPWGITNPTLAVAPYAPRVNVIGVGPLGFEHEHRTKMKNPARTKKMTSNILMFSNLAEPR